LAHIGVRPRGYRSPGWDVSEHTLDLLEELGFTWDSSLMANDLHPYYPRQVTRPSTVRHGMYEVADSASVFGQSATVLEIPVSWYLDDFPAMEFVSRVQPGMTALRTLEERWRTIYDYAATEEEGCCYALTIHPQTSGRAHMILLLDGLISYMKGRGAVFMTLSEIADATDIQRPLFK
jgi:peptidoglycan/xylan/chitin deacetylase (PgdA/CDA1 family)